LSILSRGVLFSKNANIQDRAKFVWHNILP
jgi:hypothetical protein